MDGYQDSTENTSSDAFQMVNLSEEQPVVKPLFQKLIRNKENKESLEDKSGKTGKNRFYKTRWFRIVSLVSLVLVGLGAWLGIVGFMTYGSLRAAADHGGKVGSAIESRDLALAKSELSEAKSSLTDAQKKFAGVTPLKFIPFFGLYLRDLDHAMNAGQRGIEAGELALLALEPYADVLGFSGSTQKTEFQSAEERIIFMATTVEKLAPQMDSIGGKLKDISSELEQINEKRYPKSMMGKEVRSKIASVKQTVKRSSESISQFQPFVKLLPDLLGNPDPRRYLILFQNDAELRPTGGFLTAYATMRVLRGKIDAGVSEDIYTLDSAFKKKIPAPDPIKKYLPLVYQWNLRDMNLSPDFKVSMDTFTENYRTVPIAPEVDAIIAIDTEVPVRLLKILGPIGVPGYGGKFSSENDPRCDCPQVIYELENIITKPTYEIREGRKSILGPLMNSMLANMMGSPKAKWAEFFTVFTESIKEKHLLMYFYDSKKQEAVEALGAAGRINAYAGDYLHINDTNFAGAKSNLFVEQEVTQEISVGSDGSYTKKLTLTYRNPAPGSNCNLEAGQLCLNGLLRDWMRVYVPKGAKLTAARGFELDMGTGEDLGYTVFDGFFTLSPQSSKKLEIEYTVPAGVIGNEFKMLIQKQPGIDPVKHTLILNGKKPVIKEIDSDTEITLAK